MIAMLTLTDVHRMCDAVGIHLREVQDDNERSQNYIWTTPEDETLYIGVSTGEGADLIRLRNEDGWVTFTPSADSYLVGFQRLIWLQRGRKHRFAYDVNDTTAREVIDRIWHDDQFDPPVRNATDLERFLIRIHVLCGVPIGNSSLAGQWESMNYDPINMFAEAAIGASGYDGWRRGVERKP